MPGSKWNLKDTVALQQMKDQLQPILSTYPPYPEVTGDRRLLRFLKGYNLNVEKAVKAYQEFIKWRKDNDVDAIRNDILYGGKNHPITFPHAETILRILPQIVLAHHTTDYAGQPITLETFDFDPNHVLEEMSVEQYLVFLIYSLEFRTLILEQMAEARDAAYLASHPNIEDREDGYGCILKLCCLRDLNGVGFKHVGRKTQAIVKTVLDIAVPNYQEYLGKSYMVNVPWVFETVWVFVKKILDES